MQKQEATFSLFGNLISQWQKLMDFCRSLTHWLYFTVCVISGRLYLALQPALRWDVPSLTALPPCPDICICATNMLFIAHILKTCVSLSTFEPAQSESTVFLLKVWREMIFADWSIRMRSTLLSPKGYIWKKLCYSCFFWNSNITL